MTGREFTHLQLSAGIFVCSHITKKKCKHGTDFSPFAKATFDPARCTKSLNINLS